MAGGVREMRLQVIDTGADLPTRATFGLMRRLTGVEVPDVIRMAGYRHRFFGSPFHVLVQDVMRGPSEWSEGERELIVAFTSARNECPFCVSAHSVFADERFDDPLFDLAVRDPTAPELGPQLSAVLVFLDKLAARPEDIEEADVEAVRRAGVTEAALEDAVMISVLFHVINRVMNALGAPALEGRQLAVARRFIGRFGYTLPPTIRYLSRGR
jgi:uncharacterized peroxidase-related enzyme